MASGGVIAAEAESAPGVSEEEGRGDGSTADTTDPKEGKKSRKFKPFEAMRKLFKGGRKRTKSKDESQISVVSVKAKSTTALTSAGSLDDEDDDSDGGFKSHQSKQKLQGGKRSISEDSVFNPGDRGETSLTALKTVTVSEENIHKNAFQNELFSKLKKRHSQYSDEDDGLPQSPVPPVTTADIIMGGSLKPHPGKSSSRESEKSLISVDSSDNEMDDPFLSKWNSPGKPRSRSSDQSPPPEKGITMDFEAVKSTQALNNEAAKHKRSVKPVRKTHRQSRKKRENVATLMPRLNEESPTKLQSEDDVFMPSSGGDVTDTSILTVTSKPGLSEKPVVTMVTSSATPKPSVGSIKQTSEVQTKPSTDSAAKPSSETLVKASVDTNSSKVSSVTLPGTVKVEVKKEPVNAPASKPGPVADQDVPRARSTSVPLREKEDTSDEKSTELSQALSKRRSLKLEPDDVPKDVPKDSAKISLDKPEADKGKVSDLKTVTSGDASGSSGSVDKPKISVQKPAEDTKSVLRKAEESKPVPKPAESTKPSSVSVIEKTTDKQVSKSVITSSGDIKHTVKKQPSDESNKEDSDAKSDTSSIKSESFKKDVGFRVGNGSPSTKEDYKLKRQSRSKTLPEQPQLPEDYTAKVQRAKSQRAESSPISTPAARQTAYNPTPAAKKIDPKRFSLHDASTSGEPEWMAAIKKKKAAENAETKGPGPEPKKEVMSMSMSAKDTVIKETEKPAERMTRSFTASSSTSSSFTESSTKSDSKKPETFVINTSRATSVKVPPKADTKSESGPVRFGSVKSPTKPVNIITSASSPVKPVSTTQTSSTSTKSSTGTSNSMSKSYTSTTSSIKPDSIKQFGSTASESNKDPPKVSPTEEAKKMFSRGQSMKAVPSETTKTPSRSGSVKSSSSVKPASTSVAKGPVQSQDSSSDKSQKDSVPAWRSGVSKPAGSVRIEIIEKEPKQEVALRKKSTPAPTTDPDTCRDTSSANRSSKVLDMVKNFQKLQVS